MQNVAPPCTPPLAPPCTPPLAPPCTPPLAPPCTPPLAPPPQNDISSSELLTGTRTGSTVDNGDDRPQFFPMTFVKARISCQIPKQSNADLPHTFNRLSECSVVACVSSSEHRGCTRTSVRCCAVAGGRGNTTVVHTSSAALQGASSWCLTALFSRTPCTLRSDMDCLRRESEWGGVG